MREGAVLKRVKILLFAILATTFILSAQAISLKDYQRAIAKSGYTVVEYWAPWCGNCAAFKPQYERARRALRGKVRFLELNVDRVDDVESTFGLKYGLPTLILFKDGAEVSKLPGGGFAEEVVAWIKSNI